MEEWKEQRVVIGTVVTTRNRLIVQPWIYILNHPYIQALDVWKLEERGRRKKRRTKVVSVYDNHLQAHQAWNKVGNNTRRRALAEAQ